MTRPPPDAADAQAQVPDLECRLAEVVGVIEELAALRFDARATVGPDGDIVDAVAAGVNSLGEELAASYREIERRVADRTAELAVATRELRRRALHDDLTGLPNRTVFWDRLAHRLSLAGRRGTPFAVLFLDLDGFKAVNDTWGHAAGDRLLVDVAHRVAAELRAGDTAARVGGDEFVVLLDEVDTGQAALAVAQRLNEALRGPYELAGHRYVASVSIGVAMCSQGLATPDAMVAAADSAMYDAKRRGAGLSVLHSEDEHDPVRFAEPEADLSPARPR